MDLGNRGTPRSSNNLPGRSHPASRALSYGHEGGGCWQRDCKQSWPPAGERRQLNWKGTCIWASVSEREIWFKPRCLRIQYLSLSRQHMLLMVVFMKMFHLLSQTHHAIQSNEHQYRATSINTKQRAAIQSNRHKYKATSSNIEQRAWIQSNGQQYRATSINTEQRATMQSNEQQYRATSSDAEQ